MNNFSWLYILERIKMLTEIFKENVHRDQPKDNNL